MPASYKVVGGTSAVEADVDSNKNLLTVPGLPSIGAAGGFYSLSGFSATVGASLSASTPIASMRLAATSTRMAYITRLRAQIGVVTVGTSALVPGINSLQRFSAAACTGGTDRSGSINRLNAALGTTSDITSANDHNSSLTTTNVVFGTQVGSFVVPIFVSGGPMWYEFVMGWKYPLVLRPGDGLMWRTLQACPATQTWIYSYTYEWFEK